MFSSGGFGLWLKGLTGECVPFPTVKRREFKLCLIVPIIDHKPLNPQGTIFMTRLNKLLNDHADPPPLPSTAIVPVAGHPSDRFGRRLSIHLRIGGGGHSHVKVQATQLEGCCELGAPARQGHNDSPVAAQATAGHHSCRHVAFTAPPVTINSRDSHAPDDTSAASTSLAVASCPSVADQLSTNGFTPKTFPYIADPLLHQRTIVLLI
ncbi:MAG: hypothetical protein MZW92_00895 [Comamonadaceae bacterium]|nr:hypothetical protein [Comamonadaceae bacterium]